MDKLEITSDKAVGCQEMRTNPKAQHIYNT